MSHQLNGKVAIVTGASKGIGAAIAEALARAGASVVVNYATSRAGAEAVAAKITTHGGKAVAVQADVADRAGIERLFADTKQAFGGLDILINNAGIYEFLPLEEVTEEHFHRQFNLNVLGLILCCQKAVKSFGDHGGCILNISSLAASLAPAGGSVYSGTKAAVNAVTRSLAQELAPRRIRVNSINPGLIETEGTHSTGIAGSEFQTQVEKKTPLGRIGRPEDVAPMAVFLASDDAAWITGESFYISGGMR
jgi:3-oxoacyl-[acyl-carrier protein] reductase